MSGWWVPRTLRELESAVADSRVVESHHFEAKAFSDRGVPASVGRSVAGLAVDGGVLVLGLEEDKARRLFTLQPRPLAGVPEAFDQVVASTVTPDLRVTATSLTRDDGTGYLVVQIPASPRAPHMYDGRYYRRNDTTTSPMSDAEVRALWLRHLDRRSGLERILAAEVDREPVSTAMRTNARLFVIAQPVSADPRLLLDAVEGRDLHRWFDRLSIDPNGGRRLFAAGSRGYSPTFAEAGQVSRRAHGVARSRAYVNADRTVDAEAQLKNVVDLEAREDGGLRLYYGRASDVLRDVPYLMLRAIVGEVAGIVEIARIVSETCGFRGAWGFGVALRGIRSIAAYDPQAHTFANDWGFSEDEYDEVTEVDDATLHDSGSPVLEALAGRLVRATTGQPDYLAGLDLFVSLA